jgi:3-methylfumaryl-CoA hydratase
MTKSANHVGMTRESHDLIRAWPVAALAATLEDGMPEAGEGDALPPLRHWLHFLPVDPLSEAGSDGHARTGDFLPDTGLPRRMWAGGRITFHRALPIGVEATKLSRIDDVTEKEGRSGRLVFVKLTHEISDVDGVAITEEQDLVYREPPRVGDAAPRHDPAPQDAEWRRTVDPDPVLLLRYSALTFHRHRIHYDHPYVTGVEGYPGLVVHGPLLATLMADLACINNPGRRLARFSFRGRAPVICGEPFDVAGRPDGANEAALWIDAGGIYAMEGRAVFE